MVLRKTLRYVINNYCCTFDSLGYSTWFLEGLMESLMCMMAREDCRRKQPCFILRHLWIVGSKTTTASKLRTAGSDVFTLSPNRNILYFILKLISVAFDIRSPPLFEETFNQEYNRVQKPGGEHGMPMCWLTVKMSLLP